VSIRIRAVAEGDEVSAITALLNEAYAPLAEAGMKYVASWQDDAITRRRMARGTGYVALDGDTLVGTITLSSVEGTKGCPWYDRDDVCSFGQFAVLPSRQGEGIGARMLAYVEDEARRIGAVHIALDTAETASELIAYYQRLGYVEVETVQWDETNYRSVIMSKRLA